MRTIKLKIAILVSLFLIFYCSCSTEVEQYEVTRVVDGDTIIVARLGKIRLIGVDTPEMKHPDEPVQYFAEEAKDYVKSQVLNKKVTLKFDQNKRDQFNRWLAYVYLPDGSMLNAKIIQNGFGYVYIKEQFKYKNDFIKYEGIARKEKRGIWANHDLELIKISWKYADKFYNKKIIVTGKIVDTHNTGKICYLNFNKDWKNSFTAVIFSRDYSKFPDKPDEYYLEKSVEITGIVKKYKARPEIIINGPSQIKIIN